MPQYILALDQGTTSSRALLFDAAGEVAALAQQEFRQNYPRPGWVEHDAREIWSAQYAVARRALEHAGVDVKSVAAIAITNQRETTVLWDRFTGEPIAPAIVWQDRRTAERVEALEAQGLGPLVSGKTGLRLDAYFSATKIEWLLDHVSGARQRAEKGEILFGTIDSWLIWNLTRGAEHVTDTTNASRTLLCDLRSGQWDDELLDIFRIPRAMLPRIEFRCGRLYASIAFRCRCPDCRRCRRSAGCGLWRSLFCTGIREKHLRHRWIPADECRRRSSPK